MLVQVTLYAASAVAAVDSPDGSHAKEQRIDTIYSFVKLYKTVFSFQSLAIHTKAQSTFSQTTSESVNHGDCSVFTWHT